MGHGGSKSSSSDESADGGGSDSKSRPSYRERIKQKFHLHRPPTTSQHSNLIDHDHFAGIALVTLKSAEMKFKDKWLACISIGEQTFRTQEKKFLVEKNGPHLARVSVFETNKLSKNNLIGYCEIDIFEFLSQASDSDVEVFELFDPSSSNVMVGKISVSCSIEDPIETEKSFARRILSIVDYNGDGKLSFSEFSELINAFGNQLAARKKEELFKAADVNGDGVVSMDELATLLAVQQEREPLINCCPVCGELLEISDKLNSMIHMSLCFDEGTGNQVMTGGFLTDKQASYGWMFKLSEWAHVSTYDVGLNSGSSASHIVVFDRRKKRLVEEIIDGKIVLSMRAIYQSKVGLGIMDKGAKEILQSLSEKQGKKMNSTFNEFFIRELKPGARPIACVGRDDVAVCAADSRLMAFSTAEESCRFWIKGRKFSIQGLLGNIPCSNAFIDGTLVIFRLAPQDYHRFHFPVSGTIEQIVDIPGCLYTVNPIAVNSKYCNVFTENKRAVSIISTADFGKFGYFSFGGSTVVCVFEKDSIALDEDLLANSTRSLETLVSLGMQLGVSSKKRADLSLPDINNCVLGD
ncbi:C2 calcium/lipid-binding domain, CaLB [Cynara cardunculus var. scolymus]|uniref:C2 calcium/lipid-binding domain, CaLB n=1 Tax=Cynara cardunculus var. scolymus TaxID=59895 RepID=A0A103YKT5_CYNCS|nr:C2 calcium/lipid-binding domain, CaLB [Cynara cardunculus var. scolymus]